MKKIVFVFASGMMLIACAKATIDTPVIEDPTNDTVKEAAVTLTAIMPGFTSDTKATISDDGTFSWIDGANADQIAVRYVNGGDEEYVTFTCTNAATGEFTGEPSEGYSIATTGNIAFYPSGYRGEPSSYNGTADSAGRSFQMKATEIVGSTLQFQHDNALLKVTVSDIPSIATALEIGSSVVSVSLPDGGNLTLKVPVVASAKAPLTISVKMGDNTLFSKTTSNGVEIQKGIIYTHIPNLTVAPNFVYFVRNIDGSYWDNNDSTKLSDCEGTTYSAEAKGTGGQGKFFRFNVQYPEKTVSYGNNDANVDGSSGGQFVGDSDKAAFLPDYGINNYVISFDYVSGEFMVTTTTLKMYVIGINNSWSFNNTHEMTRVLGDVYCWTGKTSHSGAKIYEEGVTNWGDGTYPSGDLDTSASAGTNDISIFAVSSELSSAFVDSDFTYSTVVLRGSDWDDFGTPKAFTKSSTHKGLWLLENLTFTEGSRAKILLDEDWTGTENNGVYVSDYHSYTLATKGAGNDFYFHAGTYDLAYIEGDNRLVLVKK